MKALWARYNKGRSEVNIMDENFIRKRMTELRMKKGVSGSQMSLDMGHSRNYIQKYLKWTRLALYAGVFFICANTWMLPQVPFSMKDTENPALMQKRHRCVAHITGQRCVDLAWFDPKIKRAWIAVYSTEMPMASLCYFVRPLFVCRPLAGAALCCRSSCSRYPFSCARTEGRS